MVTTRCMYSYSSPTSHIDIAIVGTNSFPDLNIRGVRVYRARVYCINSPARSEMERCRQWCCCCCYADVEDKGRTVPNASITEEDYLLPGSEWDPSISTASSVHQTTTRRSWRTGLLKRRSRARGGSGSSTSSAGNGDYVPPHVPPTPSRTLPTFEEFKLLKTVGKGAFGKVSVATPPADMRGVMGLPAIKLQWLVLVS